MTNRYISEEVDIYLLPKVESQLPDKPGFEVTIGDLHANAIKLLFFLIKHGIAKKLTDANYKQLVTIYRKDKNGLTRADLDDFKNILGKIEFANHTKVRLIGDELADRGSNDYFTLMIFEKLQQNNIPLEILVSNHGIEFIEATEKQKNFHPAMLEGEHAQSLERLNVLVEKGLVKRTEILDSSRKAHKPALKAISYTLNDDGSINIYSHAGIGLNTIQGVAAQLGVPYCDDTAVELAQTVDMINLVFQKHVHNNSLHTLYTRKQMEAGYRGVVTPKAAFVMLMWNRDYKELDRPEMKGNYTINFVHGHDSDEKTQKNIYNLDNNLGKFVEYRHGKNWSIGEYTVLCSQSGEAAQ